MSVGVMKDYKLKAKKLEGKKEKKKRHLGE